MNSWGETYPLKLFGFHIFLINSIKVTTIYWFDFKIDPAADVRESSLSYLKKRQYNLIGSTLLSDWIITDK